MRNYELPGNELLFNEMLSWMELPRLLASVPGFMTLPRGQGQQVTVLPGFGAGDLSTLPLRQFLSGLGYQAGGWSQGTNNGDVLQLISAVREKLERQGDRDGEPRHLVGWSLGGYIAREVAREIPDYVSSVITLGSPVVGGPKYTRVADLFELRGESVDEIERLVDERNRMPLKVPVTAIYSRRDGVVAWQACIDQVSPQVEHVEVDASHIGLGISAEVFTIIARRLAA